MKNVVNIDENTPIDCVKCGHRIVCMYKDAVYTHYCEMVDAIPIKLVGIINISFHCPFMDKKPESRSFNEMIDDVQKQIENDKRVVSPSKTMSADLVMQKKPKTCESWEI